MHRQADVAETGPVAGMGVEQGIALEPVFPLGGLLGGSARLVGDQVEVALQVKLAWTRAEKGPRE